MSIRFRGKDYDSVEAMPPDVRRSYDIRQQAAAQLQSLGEEPLPAGAQANGAADQQADEVLKELAEAEQQMAGTSPAPAGVPAWGGPRPAGAVPVPVEFDSVTSLGPATAVHLHTGVRLPHFGPPRPNVLVLYRDGLAFQTGKDLHTWRWEEVAVILSNLWMNAGEHTAWTLHEYTLTKSGGETMILDDQVKDIEDAIGPIKKAVYAHLLPPLAQAYGAGQAIAFGPVTVHKQNGLTLDGKLYAWNTILDVKVDRGRLSITLRDTKKGQTGGQARASAIGNIELLGDLIGLKFYEPALYYY